MSCFWEPAMWSYHLLLLASGNPFKNFSICVEHCLWVKTDFYQVEGLQWNQRALQNMVQPHFSCPTVPLYFAHWVVFRHISFPVCSDSLGNCLRSHDESLSLASLLGQANDLSGSHISFQYMQLTNMRKQDSLKLYTSDSRVSDGIVSIFSFSTLLLLARLQGKSLRSTSSTSSSSTIVFYC